MPFIPEILGCNHAYMSTKDTYVGLELEVESVSTEDHWVGFDAGWIDIKEDHSLRNYGREFITKPRPPKEALELFKNVHATVQWRNPREKFSQRTSIHVHVNCQNMTPAQVRQLVLLYALYEEAFFGMVSPERRDNIHCVPLTDTHLVNLFKNEIGYMAARWHKYTALNIIPLRTLGTVEFRHMQGHDDPALMSDWLAVLDYLVALAKTEPLSINTLSEQHIKDMFAYLFGGTQWFKETKPFLPNIIKNTLINVKVV